MIRNCIYYVEGECEKKLIGALKEQPVLIYTGKVKVRNVVSELIPRSELLTIKKDTAVILVFDTDIPKTDLLNKNIANLKKFCSAVKVLTVAQVPDFESELVRSTDVKNVSEITKSKSGSDFKRDFCRLTDPRHTLDNHGFDIDKIWAQNPTGVFSSIKQNGKDIKN